VGGNNLRRETGKNNIQITMQEDVIAPEKSQTAAKQGKQGKSGDETFSFNVMSRVKELNTRFRESSFVEDGKRAKPVAKEQDDDSGTDVSLDSSIEISNDEDSAPLARKPVAQLNNVVARTLDLSTVESQKPGKTDKSKKQIDLTVENFKNKSLQIRDMINMRKIDTRFALGNKNGSR